MSLHKKILSGGSRLGASQLIVQVCSLARNAVFGRVLSLADFGIASIFTLTLTLLESISDLALDKLVVQSRSGDDERFQGMLQMLMAGRGMLIGCLIALAAHPVAILFGAPRATWAFRGFAFVPLMKGFLHLDVYRAQRELRFGMMVKVEIVAAVLSTVAVWPLVHWLRDYSAVLWVVLLQAGLTTICSHCLAERPYRWAWDRPAMKGAFHFGWPLLVNGLLLFLVLQGDRFVIGTSNTIFGKSIYSKADLGLYSAALALTLIPTGILAKVCTSLFLPMFSRLEEHGDDFEAIYSSCSQLCAAISGLAVLPFVLMGGWVMVAIYGNKYAQAQQFVGLLAVTQSLRVARITPTLAAMSKGDTMNAMLSNFWRLLSISGAFFVAWLGGSLAWIAAMGLVGEFLALAYAVVHLRRCHHTPAGLCLKPAAGVGCLICAAMAVLPFLSAGGAMVKIASTCAFLMLYVACAAAALPAFRELLIRLACNVVPNRRIS